VLVNRPPARDQLAGPFATVATADDPAGGQVQLQVDPARAGQNDVHLYFLSAEGLPRPVDAIEITVGRAGIPPRRVTVTPVTPDHASAYGVAMPSPGTWTLTITTVRQGQSFTTTVEVPIR
jgi:copper transport protein